MINIILIKWFLSLAFLVFCIWFAIRLVRKYDKIFFAFVLVAMSGLIFIGSVCNNLAIIFNGGFMPVLVGGKFSDTPYQLTSCHIVATENTKLKFLIDRHRIAFSFSKNIYIISIGDIIICVAIPFWLALFIITIFDIIRLLTHVKKLIFKK